MTDKPEPTPGETALQIGYYVQLQDALAQNAALREQLAEESNAVSRVWEALRAHGVKPDGKLYVWDYVENALVALDLTKRMTSIEMVQSMKLTTQRDKLLAMVERLLSLLDDDQRGIASWHDAMFAARTAARRLVEECRG